MPPPVGGTGLTFEFASGVPPTAWLAGPSVVVVEPVAPVPPTFEPVVLVDLAAGDG